MKHRPAFIALIFLCLSLCMPFATLRADEGLRMSVSLRYATSVNNAYTTTVPRTGGSVTLPISVSDSHRWVVGVVVADNRKTFFIDVSDPALLAPGGKDLSARPLTFFEGEFDLMSGKAITVLKSDQNTLEITLTLE